MQVRAFAAFAATEPLGPPTIERRELGPHDVLIEILYSGICHSDIHQAATSGAARPSRWCPATRSSAASPRSAPRSPSYTVGDRVGVGCMVDSCRAARPARQGEEQYCEKGSVVTYNGTETDGKTDLRRLLARTSSSTRASCCTSRTGSTSPAPRRCSAPASPPTRRCATGAPGPARRSASSASAASATWRSSSRTRWAPRSRCCQPVAEEEGGRAAPRRRRLLATSDPATFKKLAGRFDLIIDTVSATHDCNAYLGLLRSTARWSCVGAPDEPLPVPAFALIGGRQAASPAR